MINIYNEKDISNYKSIDKIYIPTDYINSNYSYHFNGDYINIITNNNCYNQYNSTFCNCLMYNMKNNVISEPYTCNINSNLPIVPYESITDDVNYSNTLKTFYLNNISLYLLMFVVAILLCHFLLKERSSY